MFHITDSVEDGSTDAEQDFFERECRFTPFSEFQDRWVIKKLMQNAEGSLVKDLLLDQL